MSREGELVKNTAVLSLGKLLPRLTTFVTLPILTAYLTKAEYGTYDLITTLVMLVIPIATLQIQSAAFRFLIDCRGDKERSSEIISDIFLYSLPISFAASIIIQFFFASYGTGIRVMIAAYFFFDTMNATLGQIARGLGHNKKFSIGAILVSVFYMFAVVGFVYLFRGGLFGLLLALTAGQVVGTVYLAVSNRIWNYISYGMISKKKMKELLAYSWPMVPNNLSTWVLRLSDRLVITGFLGVEANAVYSVANRIPSILNIAQGILVMAWQENASIAVNDEDAGEYYSKMFDRILAAAFGLTALLIAATPILFKLLIRGDYDEAYYQMPVLILAMFFGVLSAFVGGIYVAHKRTANVGLSTVVAAIINLTIDLCFVNIIGIWAGSLSTLAAYAVLYIYRIINCQKFQPVKVNIGKQLVMMAVIIVMLVMCFLRKTPLDIVNLVLGVGIFVIFNRDLIRSALKKAKKMLRR